MHKKKEKEKLNTCILFLLNHSDCNYYKPNALSLTFSLSTHPILHQLNVNMCKANDGKY